jgi:hypothetical protein
LAGELAAPKNRQKSEIVGKGAQTGELELQQRKMRLVEIDRINLRRSSDEVGQRVAPARRDRDDGRSDTQAQRCEIGDGIFPDLRIDQPAVPERVKPVPNRRIFVATAVTGDTCDQLTVHASLESAIRSGYRPLASVLRQATLAAIAPTQIDATRFLDVQLLSHPCRANIARRKRAERDRMDRCRHIH